MADRRRSLPTLEKVLLSWSGGKDSAIALYEILKAQTYHVCALVTTVTQPTDRISMHGVRRELLELQAASVGLPLEIVLIPPGASNEEYESKMADLLRTYKKDGVTKVAFGDLFLEDLRKYREEKLAAIGMEALFPIWKMDTNELSHSLGALGFKAITTCVDTQSLDKSFVGRIIDDRFLSEMPATADRCGENGEYHSFVYDGPIFNKRIDFAIGEKDLRDDRFYYCDLIPSGSTFVRQKGEKARVTWQGISFCPF
jgi:uncharacterized protein (TIGR00290 family)